MASRINIEIKNIVEITKCTFTSMKIYLYLNKV